MKTELGEVKYEKYPILKESFDKIWADINYKDYFEAPVKEKIEMGNIKIGVDTTEIMSVEILTGNRIERKDVLTYFIELMKKIKIEI